MRHPGPQLRAVREQAGVSLRALAATIGVPKSTLERWESGIPRVPYDALESWGAALGYTVEVIARPASGVPTAAAWTVEQDAVVATLLERVAHLSDRDARLIRSMIETAASS